MTTVEGFYLALLCSIVGILCAILLRYSDKYSEKDKYEKDK